jgi:antitoxin component YwqK of YwqJK toxin-antitoxin module
MSYQKFESPDGHYTETWQDERNICHRLGLPAYISYYPNGILSKETYYIRGVRHRLDGPADIDYHLNGSVYSESFVKNGDMDRRDGPARIHYSDDGSIIYEAFYIDDHFLGHDKRGFWGLWGNLKEEERNNINILKLLVRYL